MIEKIHATTVLAVRDSSHVVIISDGQVTMGETVLKGSARKVRRLFGGKVLAGFAGSTADALSLFEKFEQRLKDYNGNLMRAAVELAKDWRTDRILRRLEALLLVADREKTLLITGTGDIIEPEGRVASIGSGGPYAMAAARALSESTEMRAEEVARKAMEIAGSMCIYTNTNFSIEVLETAEVVR